MFETANTDTIRTRGPMMFLLTTAGQLVVTGAVVIATIDRARASYVPFLVDQDVEPYLAAYVPA